MFADPGRRPADIHPRRQRRRRRRDEPVDSVPSNNEGPGR
jgi:hypothetical protein